MPEAPQGALRAVFAGIGRILNVTDKIRNKPAEAGAPANGTAPAAAPETAAPKGAAEPPLPNYDGLTIASVRARLRNLSIAQLGQLIEYEKANAGREDFIAMFERRIAKIESEK